MTTTCATPLQTARKLRDVFDARAADADAIRTMPADLVSTVSATGLFAMARPRTLGGLELDPLAQLEVIEDLAYGDGSAGWTVMIAGSVTTHAWLQPDIARALLADDPRGPVSHMIGPLGTAEPDGPGYVVRGRWPFVSGARHATHHVLGVRVAGADVPGWQLAFVEPRDAEILDTWDAVGLRGTGSHDVVVRNARVPATHIVAPMAGPARHDGPLWRLPFVTQLAVGHAAVALGVARRALDEFVALATRKRRGRAIETVAETGEAQVALARAEAGLEAARALAVDALGGVWETALAGDVPDLTTRARVLAAVLNAQDSAVAAIDAVFPFAGAGALHTRTPLARCHRDLHAAGQHVFLAADARKRVARVRLGLEVPDFLI